MLTSVTLLHKRWSRRDLSQYCILCSIRSWSPRYLWHHWTLFFEVSASSTFDPSLLGRVRSRDGSDSSSSSMISLVWMNAIDRSYTYDEYLNLALQINHHFRHHAQWNDWSWWYPCPKIIKSVLCIPFNKRNYLHSYCKQNPEPSSKVLKPWYLYECNAAKGLQRKRWRHLPGISPDPNNRQASP